MSRIHALLLALALGTLPAFALADEASSPSLEQVLIESASTPKAHQALAAYYAGKAAEERKDAAYHRAMGKAYGGAKGSQIAMMKDHCEKLASLADDEAKQYDAMASMHRDMAK
jgi:hypothetical protein